MVLIGSTLFTLTIGVGGYVQWKKIRKKRLVDEAYFIRTIIQTGPEKEALKTAYLAEVLSLSTDRATSLYAIREKDAQKKLLSSPVIAKAKVKKMPPSTLYIDYEVRKPFAYLGDFENMGVDREGYIFPIHPFFSPKRLPEIYLGIEELKTERLSGKDFMLARDIINSLEDLFWENGVRLVRVDVSKALSPSLGQKEVVLLTEEEIFARGKQGEILCVFPKMIRLCPKIYEQQIQNFFQLKRAMQGDYSRQLSSMEKGGRFAPKIIDLRIPHLAFVNK